MQATQGTSCSTPAYGIRLSGNHIAQQTRVETQAFPKWHLFWTCSPRWTISCPRPQRADVMKAWEGQYTVPGCFHKASKVIATARPFPRTVRLACPPRSRTLQLGRHRLHRLERGRRRGRWQRATGDEPLGWGDRWRKQAWCPGHQRWPTPGLSPSRRSQPSRDGIGRFGVLVQAAALCRMPCEVHVRLRGQPRHVVCLAPENTEAKSHAVGPHMARRPPR